MKGLRFVDVLTDVIHHPIGKRGDVAYDVPDLHKDIAILRRTEMNRELLPAWRNLNELGAVEDLIRKTVGRLIDVDRADEFEVARQRDLFTGAKHDIRTAIPHSSFDCREKVGEVILDPRQI